MTQIFNGYADSGSYPSIDFYRVDIDHAQDVVQHVSGQTVRLDPIIDRAHADVLKYVLFLCWSYNTQIPGFYAYRRGQKLGELIGAYPDRLQVCMRRVFSVAGSVN